MGRIIDPRPPQWERKQPVDDVREDRVLCLAESLLRVLTGETDPTAVQLAALRLVQKAVIGNYSSAMGLDNAKAVLAQATELASCYAINIADYGDKEHGK
jgi:hypothetical protein